MIVGSGGVDYATAIEAGGSQVVVATGIDNNATIYSGGSQIVAGYAGGAVVYSGGTQDVNYGAASGTQVSAGGTQDVYNRATGTVISAGGSEYVGSGAVTSLTTIDGGTLELDYGASLGGSTLTFAPVATPAHGGTLLIDTTPVLSGTIRGFAPGDTIDLALIGFVSGGSVSLLAGNVLQVIATGPVTGGTYDIQLDPAQSFAGETFSVGGDGNNTALDGTSGGTAITLACFREGTLIATAGGEAPVEALRVGDCVRLAGGGTAPVRWVGHRRVDCRRHPRPADVWPVRVAAGAFAPGRPARELFLSPDHAVAVGGALIPVRYLLNGASIAQVAAEAVTYWHVELDRHAVILAEALACESYLDTGNRDAFAEGGAVIQAHPDFARRQWDVAACAPLVCDGPEVVAARRRLLRRAAGLGFARTADPGLRLLADGVALRPSIAGRRYDVRLPAGARALRLVSRIWVPAEMRAEEGDTRRLGVALSRLWLDGRQAALDSPALGAGWQAAEPGWRWTDGDAALEVAGATVVGFELAMAGTYWRVTSPPAPSAAPASCAPMSG